MMMLSERLTERTSTTRRLLMVLMATLAVAVALSMVFADDAEAKKKKKKKRHPATYVSAPTPANCNQPPVYNGESVARAWGSNSITARNPSSTPVDVANLSGVQTLASGNGHSLALMEDCTVLAWGQNGSGQLGNGTTTFSNTPVRVSNLSGVKAIAAGDFYSLAKVSKPPVAQQ